MTRGFIIHGTGFMAPVAERRHIGALQEVSAAVRSVDSRADGRYSSGRAIAGRAIAERTGDGLPATLNPLTAPGDTRADQRYGHATIPHPMEYLTAEGLYRKGIARPDGHLSLARILPKPYR